MKDKEEGEDIEDSLMKDIYKEKEIEDYTKIKIYKSQDYLSQKKYYKEKFNDGINKEFFFHKEKISSIDWLDNYSGANFITGSIDNSIKIWDLNISINSSKQNSSSGSPIMSIHNECTYNISSRSNNETGFLSSSLDKHIKFFDIRDNNISSKSAHDKAVNYEINHLKFNNDGSQFGFIGKDGKEKKDGNRLFIYDFGKFEEIQQIHLKQSIYDFVFDKNNDRIFAACDDGNVYLVNIKSSSNNRNSKKSITGSLFPLNTIDIDSKNKYFITGGNDGLIINYNIDELMSCKTYKKNDLEIKQVMYNYDDRIIASIYEGKNIEFFSTELDDHLFTIYTNNNPTLIKWNRKRNTLVYLCDESKNMKNNFRGNGHFFIIPNL
jgi:WD40 repeat protein